MIISSNREDKKLVMKFIKNAEHIDLVRTNSEKAEYDLHINDETVHLNSRHPFSRYASLTTPESVIDSLKGGHFVVDNGSLKEYRDASYKGFMHNDDFIERFANDNTLLKLILIFALLQHILYRGGYNQISK